MEHKSVTALGTKIIDLDQGIVEHLVAVFGNLDRGKDILHPGSCTKTLHERGFKIKVLDQHDTSSGTSVIGKPLELREIGREALPLEVIQEHPDATGGLYAKTQFLLDTERGAEIFKRIKAGILDEYSIGYDPIQVDWTKIQDGDKTISARNLREIRLWEYSPVIFAMNDATTTLSAKAGPQQQKPYLFRQEDDGMYRVYRADDEGQAMGDPLGEHETEDEAQAQLEALYAAEGEEEETEEAANSDVPTETMQEGGEPMKVVGGQEYPASAFLVVEDPEKPSTWHLQVRDQAGDLDHRLMGAAWAALTVGHRGNVYEGPGKREALAELRRLYEEEGMDTPKSYPGTYQLVCHRCDPIMGPFVDYLGRKDLLEGRIGGTCLYCQSKTARIVDIYTPIPERLLVSQDKGADLGTWIESRIHYGFTAMADDLLAEGVINREERIALSSLIGQMLDLFHQTVTQEQGVFVDMIRRSPYDQAPRSLMSYSKAGRVLAARNADRLNAALQTLNEILADAGLLTPESEPEETDQDQDPDDKIESTPLELYGLDQGVEDKTNDQPQSTEERKAGPEIPPTLDRLALIKNLRDQLSTLGGQENGSTEP